VLRDHANQIAEKRFPRAFRQMVFLGEGGSEMLERDRAAFRGSIRRLGRHGLDLVRQMEGSRIQKH
jgi:hypothetical protein